MRNIFLSRSLLIFMITSALLFVLPIPAFSQQSTQDPFGDDQLPQARLPGPSSKNLPDEEPTIRMQKQMEKKLNEERQLQLKTDTDKLFQLATQLKEQVAKSNENILSLDVIKKADEIEKLAHSVKEKMKGPG